MGFFWVVYNFTKTNDAGEPSAKRDLVETEEAGNHVQVLASAISKNVLPCDILTVKFYPDGSGDILRRDPAAVAAGMIAQLRPFLHQLREPRAVRVEGPDGAG